MESHVHGEKLQEEDGRGEGKHERIQVTVRLRPLNPKELSRNDQSDWECINETTIIFKHSLPERSMFPSAYTFDRVFREDCDTKKVYEDGAREVSLSVLCGINSSIFAYGQTSSGKTYTMTGITEYAMADIYAYIGKHEEREFVLKFSAMEIYNEAVRDLLSSDVTPLRLLDDPERGTIVEKLTEETLRDWDHLQELLSICEAQRQIGETTLNETSSRSHQILRLSIESFAREHSGKDNSSRLAASVNFVDLAGSERASQTLSAGARLKEGCHINRSLLTLGTVIRKLSKGRGGHVPYRDSKLTRILQSSLGGNAKTAIICTMSPARSHVEQSRNTLLFACCAKKVATNARVNVVMSDKALVKHLQRELARLEAELKATGHRLPPATSYSDNLLREKDAQILKMEMEMRELARQRDLAQAQLNEWIRNSGEDRESLQSGELGAPSPLHCLSAYDDELFSLYDCSSVHDYAFIYSNVSVDSTQSSVTQKDGSMGVDLDSIDESPRNSADKAQEELCKEVRCIEIDEVLTSRDDNLGQPTTTANLEEQDKGKMDSERPVDSSSSLVKSQSCRQSLTPKVLLEEQKLAKDLEREPSGQLQLTPRTSNGERNRINMSCEDGSGSPQRKKPESGMKPAEEVIGMQSFIHEMKGMARTWSRLMTNKGEVETPKDDMIPHTPSLNWPQEFERQQWEIIRLWDTCNVSLLHRTYFFLFFKGDPADSIYIEVELRRLFFLRRVFTEGGFDKSLAQNGLKITPSSCVRALKREREMLSQELQKKLSAEERENLFRKWGISVNSKQRKTQLSKMLWSNVTDMEHIKESASVVASLVGLLQTNQALKEMFQLSFMPRQIPTRSQSWKHTVSSLL